MRHNDQRRLELALTRILKPLLASIDNLAAALAPHRPTLVAAPTPDSMLVRHLNLEHLGRWIYLPGRPSKRGPKYAQEPEVIAIAGRLVGIRPGDPSKIRDEPGTRILVVAQGSAIAELPTSLTDPVDVAPREW